MADAVTTRMDVLWPGVVKAFSESQKDHVLYQAIPFETKESGHSLRFNPQEWVREPNDSTGMLSPDPGVVFSANMWREETTLHLKESEDAIRAGVLTFGATWADNFLGAIVAKLSSVGTLVEGPPDVNAMKLIDLAGPRPYRVLCGIGISAILDPKGDGFFEKPIPSEHLPSQEALIFSPGRPGPWIEQLEAKPELSWMPSGDDATLRASLRFFLQSAPECFLYSPR